MIRLTDKLSIYPSSAALMQIYCLKSAFDGSVLKADLWVQEKDDKITAVIGRSSGRIYIHAEDFGFEELKEFINTIGYSEIFCSKAVAISLRLNIQNTFVALCKKDCAKSVCENAVISTKELYNKLLLGKDGDISLPDFEYFAPDVSHRLRHFGAVAIANEHGATLAFCCKYGGVINGIAVDKKLRGCGEGSMLLSKTISAVGGDIFVCCNNKNKEFYIKNGFSETDEVVIAR